MKRPQTTKEKWISAFKALVFLAALVPFGKLAWLGLHDGPGADPIEKITRATGYWTLAFLMITLAATPLRTLSGWSWPIRFRRMLGLFAFFYASLHFHPSLVLAMPVPPGMVAQDLTSPGMVQLGPVRLLACWWRLSTALRTWNPLIDGL